jgi:hypothetical protein
VRELCLFRGIDLDKEQSPCFDHNYVSFALCGEGGEFLAVTINLAGQEAASLGSRPESRARLATQAK